MTLSERRSTFAKEMTGRRWLAVLLDRICLFVLAILTFGALSGQAQTSYGALIGTVTDSTGATVVGAQVTLKNTGTNATQMATTGNGGSYSFPNLNPGTYSVSVKQEGFQSYTRERIDVQIGGTTRADIALQVGSVSQSVTVTDASATLQTDSATLGGVIEGRQIVEAPLNGRNVNNLLDFVPGVVPGGGTQGSTVANGGSGNFQAGGQTQAIAYGNYQIGGAFSGQSLFFIDGVQSNIPENNVNSLVPTQDSVQEFRVATNDVSAEFGGYGGGVVQISTKSGTNQFHGTAYEYLRNTVFDANDWFSNHEGLGRSPLHQNQYGLNLGGPALKNRLFFFFSWEHQSLISASPTSAAVPTSAELSGDFSGDPQIIYDPTTGAPFPGNKIPTDRIDPTALRILQLETPDQSRVIQTPFTTNFFASAPIEGYQDQYNARVDANLGSDMVFARYTFWNPHNGPSDPFGTKTGSGPTGNYTQEAVLGDNHAFNRNTVADLRLSYIENYNFQYPLSYRYDMSQISPVYGNLQSQSENKEGLLPGLAIQGYGVGAALSQLYWNNNVWAVNANLTRIFGKHTIKTGGVWRQVLWTSYSSNGGLTLSATPFFTASSPTDQNTGNALASFLLGIPSNVSDSSIGESHAFLHNYGFYVTDTYQTTPKLTITAGLRWEQPGSYSEQHDLNTILQPNAPVNIGGLTSITNPVSGSSVPLKGQLAFVNSPQYKSRREEKLHWNLFSPRVGFAYRLNPATVVRSGYGISFFPAELTQDGPQLSPISTAYTNLVNTVGQPLLTTVSNPLPNGLNAPGGRSQSVLDAQLGNGIWASIPDVPYGYSQQWNLAVERALNSNSTLSVAYAGSKGTHLVMATPYTASGLNLNQLPDQYDSLGADLLNQVPNPFYGILPDGTTMGTPTVAEGYLLMPYPQYPLGVLQQKPRYGSSTYHALQAMYVHHFNHEGIVQAAYTWGKLLSDTDNTSAFQDGQGGSAVVQDNTNLKAEKSLSLQDIANNLVINYGIDLPIGHGQPYLGNLSGFANGFFGGWRVNGITTFRSGTPVAFVAAMNQLSQFGGGTPGFGPGPGIIRPNYTAGCSKHAPGSPHSEARANEWFNTDCFTQPDEFSFGNEPRVDPEIRSQGLANFDTSLNKTFDVLERTKLQFSAEIFDLFNHAQFGLPNFDRSSPGFGQISTQSNLPRTIQLALRISF